MELVSNPASGGCTQTHVNGMPITKAVLTDIENNLDPAEFPQDKWTKFIRVLILLYRGYLRHDHLAVVHVSHTPKKLLGHKRRFYWPIRKKCKEGWVAMSKLFLHKNKNLRLTNVIIRDISSEIQNSDGTASEMHQVVELMDSYIKSKGATPVGPLIQFIKSNINKNGELEVSIKIMRQASNCIFNTEAPYSAESVIRAKDCLYARYTGPESKIKFAYDKIMLTAFEEDIPLKNRSYTIFVDRQDDHIVADVFMERADNE